MNDKVLFERSWMDAFTITYRFTLPDDSIAEFPVVINRETLEVVREEDDTIPEWTKLDFHKCGHCPLSSEITPACPLSASISNVVERFQDIISYTEIEVEVETEGRRITKSSTAQQGLSALLGLIMATSGCPYTAYFKPMARFHLPFANEEETVYRAVSMYLLSQYFMNEQGESIDFALEGLQNIYKDIQELNRSMAQRIREAITHDAAVNAIVVLDFFAQTMPFAIEDNLEELRPMFDAYAKRNPNTESES
jgi:hypothetical protein